MKEKSPLQAVSIGVLAASACLILLSACAGTPSNRGGYRSSREVEVHPSMVFEDEYDYFPRYEVYYSRNRREYVYFDRNRWVRSSEPSVVPANVLLSSPTVRMDFSDSPERHHDSVVRNYPRGWHNQSDSSPERKDNPGQSHQSADGAKDDGR